MVGTQMNLHQVNSMRLVSSFRQNGLSLTVRMERGDTSDGGCEERFEITVYCQTEAEYELLLSVLPRAADFRAHTMKPSDEIAA